MRDTHKTITILDKMSSSDKERFWSKVDVKSDNECWEWQDTPNADGYGNISVGSRGTQRKLTSHRVAKTLSMGEEIPPGMLLIHMCDNPPCCNPSHLVIATHQTNMDDMVTKNRAAICFGNAKLDWDTVDCIKATSMSCNWWAKELGVSKSTISDVRNNKTWRDDQRDKALMFNKPITN